MSLFDCNICSNNKYHRTIERCIKDDTGYSMALDNLWAKYKPYAHNGFQKQFLSDESKFYSLIWEMFLANKLLEHGYELTKVDTDDAPDLCIKNGNNRIWIECSLPTRGNSHDCVPETICDGEFHEVDIDKSVLRCMQALTEKKKQHLRWIKEGICSVEDTYVIAINGCNLQLHIGHKTLPDIMRALYALGDSYTSFSKSFEVVDAGYLHNYNVKKSSGNLVRTDFFLDDSNKHIDGVLFSNDRIGFSSGSPKYCFVENIHTQHHLSAFMSNLCQIYEYSDDGIFLKI